MKNLIVSVSVMLVALCAAATQYSCLSIISETKKIGKWQSVKAWIEAAGYADEWSKCAYVSDDYPQFAAVTNALVAGGVLDQYELTALLNSTKDAAVPDALLVRLYRNETSTSSGRVKWHGKLTRQVIDTNAWTKTTVYADGTAFTDAARPPAERKVYNRQAVAETNGIPVRLAAARQRWADAKNNGNETNVTVTVRAGQ